MKTKLNIKTILKNRFWVVEGDQGRRLGTLGVEDDMFIFSGLGGVRYFDSDKALRDMFGSSILEKPDIEVKKSKSVFGYPTCTVPYSTFIDVKTRSPLFTKNENTQAVFCAGHYAILFEKGWVKSFCPKYSTVTKYPAKGPFKTEHEVKQAIRDENEKRSS